MATTSFPINPTLTAIAIGYVNPEKSLIADAVLPRVPTGKKFTYYSYSAAQGYTIPNTRVGRKSEPTMVDFGGTAINAECFDWGLDDLVPNDEIEAYERMPKPSGGIADPKSISVMLLTHLVQLDREIRVANQVFAAATYPAGNQATLAGAAQWSDAANSDPVKAITDALDVPLIRPNKLILGQAVWTNLRRHPKIVQAVNATGQGAGNVARQAVADLFELDEILVGGSFYNTARKGQAPVYVRAWGKHAALIYSSQPSALLGQPTFGFTAQYGDKIAGSIPKPEKGLRGGEQVRSGESLLEVISAPDAGFFFQNAVA